MGDLEQTPAHGLLQVGLTGQFHVGVGPETAEPLRLFGDQDVHSGGLGLIQVPDYMADEALRAGALVEVLADCRPPAVPISIVHPSARQVTPRLRALLDLLTT